MAFRWERWERCERWTTLLLHGARQHHGVQVGGPDRRLAPVWVSLQSGPVSGVVGLGGQHDQRGLQIHFFLDNYCSAHQMFGQSLQDWMFFNGEQTTRHGWSLYDHSPQASNQIFKKEGVSDKMCQQGPKLDRT